MAGRFSSRELRLSLTTVILIGAWAVVALVVEPLWDRAQLIEQRVAAQAIKLEKFKTLLGKRGEIDRRYAAIVPYLSIAGDGEASAVFLGELESLAQEANVEINLKPRPVRRGEKASRVGVELDLQASQRELFAFLDALLRMPRLIEIVRLSISLAPGKRDLLRAHLILERLSIPHA